MKANITTRIWEDSPLIGKKVKDINKESNVKITKVARGPNACDSGEIRIEEADYITFIGEYDACLVFVKETFSKKVELKKECHDCGAKEGELHKRGCDMERCPFCGRQLITCDCRYKLLGFNILSKHPTNGLPENIYKNGLTKELNHKWTNLLIAKGRIPYIILPVHCVRCLKEIDCCDFMVSDEEWNNMPQYIKKEILCRSCYNRIKKWIKNAN